MKNLLILGLLVVLISSMSFSQVHQVAPNSHLQLDLSHGMTDIPLHEQQVHEVLGAISAGLNIASAAMDLGLKIAGHFKVTCSASGYKRGNKVNIFNGLNQRIQVIGVYQDSGKIYHNKGHGDTYIGSRRSTAWEFVKKGGAATGSNGILMINLPDKTLTIFYENPWSKWNFAGYCLEDLRTDYPTQKELKAVYKRMYKTRTDWPQDSCAIADNVETRSRSFARELELHYAGYQIGGYVQYRQMAKSGVNKCFTQEVTVVIANENN